MRNAMLLAVALMVMGCGAEPIATPDGGVADDAAPDSGPACEGLAPTPTWVCCGEWVDPINDEANCGSCGSACEAGQTCRIGRCE